MMCACGGAGVETPNVSAGAWFDLERSVEGKARRAEVAVSGRSGTFLYLAFSGSVVIGSGVFQAGTVFPGFFGLG